MQDRNQIYRKTFFAASSLAAVFVLTETVMHFFGKSICLTEGCRVVAQHVRYGDISILMIGLMTFTLLVFLSFLSQYRGKAGLEPLINLILTVSLACEGFFTGYQAFSVHTPCVFCLIILGLIALLGLLRLLAGELTMLTGFAALAAVFGMFYLVPPAETQVNLPVNDRLILFYSAECKHCAEIMKELEDNKIVVAHLDVKAYAGFLKEMGIENVPTLFVNDRFQKTFYTGKDEIRRYLITCSQATKAGANKTRAKAVVVSKKGRTGAKVDIFNQQGLAPSIGLSVPDDGMCKEDESCR